MTEAVVPCRDCDAGSAVYYAVTNLTTFEREEYGLCEKHAPACDPAEFAPDVGETRP